MAPGRPLCVRYVLEMQPIVCARIAHTGYKLRMTLSQPPPRALAHPLPAGMRDLLPEEARRRRALAKRVLDHFALHGFQLVTLPAFEFAGVLERGLGTLDPADVLRFVEPESGEVAALRPDMTPQIARMVATRFAQQPLPIRLCYEGTIVRRRQGRARRHRQVPQAGVELYGVASRDGDLEILRLAASVVKATGLSNFILDLGHASIARTLIDQIPQQIAPEVTLALVQKDASRVEGLLRGPGGSAVAAPVAEALVSLPELSGGGEGGPPADDVFTRAERLLAAAGALAPLHELRMLWDAIRGMPSEGGPVPMLGGPELEPMLRVDLGNVRGFAYYTGPIFHLLAEGPGEPIGAGGRYDDLLGRFHMPMPAVGFALHLDAVARALEAAEVAESQPVRVVVAAGQKSAALVRAFRSLGVAAVVHPEQSDPIGYASAWQFSHVVTWQGSHIVATVVATTPIPPPLLLDAEMDPVGAASAILAL